jgi:hypothetical protein
LQSADVKAEVISQQHLLTEFAFLDTETYIRCRFDFSKGHLGKLAEYGRAGLVRVLITDVTRREVLRHLEAHVRAALETAKKNHHILTQAGMQPGTPPPAQDAIRSSEAAFDRFRIATRAVTVPLKANLESIVDDYFSRRPPFSDKKQSEFPDAIVAASLRHWCADNKCSAYVVSGDKDFDGICATAQELHKLESVAELLTHASVSEETHRAIVERIRDSNQLEHLLEQELIGRYAETSAASKYYAPSPISAEGRVITARIEKIDRINVIDAKQPIYTCALEFEAVLTLDLEITDVSALGSHEFFRSTLDVAERCTAEVQLRYSGPLFDIESVTVDEETINLDEMIEDFYP